MKQVLSFCLCILMPLSVLNGAESIEDMIVAKIKMEAFQNSQIMENVSWLCDVHGPRLTNSPGYRDAANWCMETLKEWGIEKTRLEAWGNYTPGWTLDKFVFEMIEP